MPDKAHEPVNLSLPPGQIGAPKISKDELTDEDELAKAKLERITPSNEKLRELAKKYPPPPEYFDGDEEMPFDPIQE
jgi:hypothetical protein